MGLQVQGPRPLSPLEQDAVRLVFCGSLNPCDLYVTIYDDRRSEANRGSNRDGGNIRINRYKFKYADALNLNSTRANTDIFKPGNMDYLSTLIHESTHQWQWDYKRYQWSGPEDVKPLPYTFTREELTEVPPSRKWWDQNPYPNKDLDNLNLLKEQHASAAQVYFVIAWQLEYSSDGLVNLTTSNEWTRVGLVKRYHEIAAIPSAHPFDPVPPDDSCDAAPPGRRVSRGCAERLSNHFGRYLVELRSGGRRTVKFA